jgi:hypothetical protein
VSDLAVPSSSAVRDRQASSAPTRGGLNGRPVSCTPWCPFSRATNQVVDVRQDRGDRGPHLRRAGGAGPGDGLVRARAPRVRLRLPRASPAPAAPGRGAAARARAVDQRHGQLPRRPLVPGALPSAVQAAPAAPSADHRGWRWRAGERRAGGALGGRVQHGRRVGREVPAAATATRPGLRAARPGPADGAAVLYV